MFQLSLMPVEYKKNNQPLKKTTLDWHVLDSYFGGGFFFATDTPYLAFGSLYFWGTENGDETSVTPKPEIIFTVLLNTIIFKTAMSLTITDLQLAWQVVWGALFADQTHQEAYDGLLCGWTLLPSPAEKDQII